MNNRMEEFIDEKMREFKEELIRIIEEENKSKTIWDIKKGDEYYYFNLNDSVYLRVFDNYPFDIKVRNIGNMFLTQEEAEFELERRKIEVIMKKFSVPFESEKENWIIYYDHFYKTVDVTYCNSADYGVYYFESKEIVQKVIDEIGKERLLKYWFKVER